MAKDSSIEWTDHTFNPWWGCTKVSPACDHCYAEAWARRMGKNIWGEDAARRFFGDAHWREPLNWNDEAKAQRRRRRVFCASMADVFEPRPDLNGERRRLWRLVAETPWLDWLLLTKRPGAVMRATPWGHDWPANVWVGTTVESQEWARVRVPRLLQIPAAVRFVSCEPLLGPLDLSGHLGEGLHKINWVIAGGESGGHARPTDPAWVRVLRDQCLVTNVPFHFKQWGNWRPASSQARRLVVIGQSRMERITKKLAGRTLDGRTWNGRPAARTG